MATLFDWPVAEGDIVSIIEGLVRLTFSENKITLLHFLQKSGQDSHNTIKISDNTITLSQRNN